MTEAGWWTIGTTVGLLIVLLPVVIVIVGVWWTCVKEAWTDWF